MGSHQGKNVKRARAESGMSQQELADAVGVSRVTISRWESAKTLPGDRLAAVADILGEDLTMLRGQDTLSRFSNGQYVSSEEDLNRWIMSVFRSDLPQDVRLVLSAIGTFMNRSIWAAPVSIDALTDETTIDPETVRRVWPEIEGSKWVEKIGPAKYLFRLKFPD